MLQEFRVAVRGAWSTKDIPYVIGGELGAATCDVTTKLLAVGKKILKGLCFRFLFCVLCILQKVVLGKSSPRWQYCLSARACLSTCAPQKGTTSSSSSAEGVRTC